MNFLRSAFLGAGESDSDAEAEVSNNEEAVQEGEESAPSRSVWGFADVIKTLASKSEEVIATYQRDLQEFGFGLKKETETVVDATTNVIAELPQQLTVGASSTQHIRRENLGTIENSGRADDDTETVSYPLQVAVKTAGDVVEVLEESLESVGQTIEDIGSSVWKGTAEIFAQVREAVAQVEEEAALNTKSGRTTSTSGYSTTAITRGKYNRYEAQVSAMQRDSGTYCDEPDDVEDFAAWKSTFSLENKKVDIEVLLKENAFMQELQSRIVPLIVEYDIFWTRYFYRLHKLQQAEDARADLVKRATTNDDEELSWDVDEAETPKESRLAQAGTSSSPVAVLPAEALVSEHAETSGDVEIPKDQSNSEWSGEHLSSPSSSMFVEMHAINVRGAASESAALVKSDASNLSPRGRTPGQDVAEEVESKSEASGGSVESDWLVVDEKSDGKAGSDKSGSPSHVSGSEAQAMGAPVIAQGRVEMAAKEVVKKVEVAEMNDVDELAMDDLEVDDDKLKQIVASGKYAGLAKAAAAEEKSNTGASSNNDDQEEDWGEWE